MDSAATANDRSIRSLIDEELGDELDVVEEVVEGRLDLDFVDRTVVTKGLMPPRPHWEAPARGATRVATAADRAAAVAPAGPERGSGTVVALNPILRDADGTPLPSHSSSFTPDPAAAPSATSQASRPRQGPAGFRKPEAPAARSVPVPGPADGGTAVSPGAPASARDGGTVVGVPDYVHDPRSPAPAAVPRSGARFEVLGAYLADDEDGRARVVGDGESFEIGSKPGSPFGDDPFVERYHAALVPSERGVTVEDFGSKNGIFMRVQGSVPLREGTLIRVGQTLLRLSPLCLPLQRKGETRPMGCPNPGYWARLDAMLTPEVIATSVPLQGSAATVGSTEGDMTLADDGFVDPRHCSITVGTGGTMLVDHDSVWGTYVQIQTGDCVPYGSELLVGSTRLTVQRST